MPTPEEFAVSATKRPKRKARKQRRSKLTRQAIRKTQHRKISGGGDAIRIRTVHGDVFTKRQERANLAPAATCRSLTSQVGDVKPCVGVQEAKGLQTSVPGGTNHSNPLNPHSGDGTSIDRTDVDNG